MFGFLRRRCGDADLAADLTQDTFVRAARAITGFTGGSETAWLLSIARNLLIDHWKRRRLDVDDGADLGSLLGSADVAHDVTTRLAVHDTLRQLGDRDRRLLTLLYVDGFSIAEVAAMSGATEGAIRTAAHRARGSFHTRFTAPPDARNSRGPHATSP